MSSAKDTAQSGIEATGDALKRFASRFATLIEACDDSQDEDDSHTLEAESLLGDAEAARATDIHLDPVEGGYRLRFRIDGQLLSVARLDVGFGRRLINQFRVLAGLDPIRAMVPATGSFSFALDEVPIDVRVTEAPCLAGDKLSIRLLSPSRVLNDIGRLGLSDEGVEFLLSWIDQRGGLLVTAGPTGSGKTTTLYTLLHQLKTRDSSVVTLEDPIEYAVDGVNQLAVNPDQGLDIATGARGMLRMDPDYLIFGELRDRSGAEAAINAAAGGRATLATLHARDAVDTVAVLRNYGVSDLEIAANLDLVIAQRLVRRVCVDCSETQPLPSAHRAWLTAQGLKAPDECYVGAGCETCSGIGFYGRIGLYELWSPTEEERAQIVEHAPVHKLRAALTDREHAFLLDDGLAKARAGLIAVADLQRLGAVSSSASPPR